MLYKVIRQFKKERNEEAWNSYIRFSGLEQIQDLCSLDSVLNVSLFTPETEEDWKNCVNEDYKIDMITNFRYAKIVSDRFSGSRILGLIINAEHNYKNENLLGFDILDREYSISLLTNCGGFSEVFSNSLINRFGLLDDKTIAYTIRDKLRNLKNGNEHARDCEVIAVFK
jgi:hypothetical protein